MEVGIEVATGTLPLLINSAKRDSLELRRQRVFLGEHIVAYREQC
jgi:hypothetical protein